MPTLANLTTKQIVAFRQAWEKLQRGTYRKTIMGKRVKILKVSRDLLAEMFRRDETVGQMVKFAGMPEDAVLTKIADDGDAFLRDQFWFLVESAEFPEVLENCMPSNLNLKITVHRPEFDPSDVELMLEPDVEVLDHFHQRIAEEVLEGNEAIVTGDLGYHVPEPAWVASQSGIDYASADVDPEDKFPPSLAETNAKLLEAVENTAKQIEELEKARKLAYENSINPSADMVFGSSKNLPVPETQDLKKLAEIALKSSGVANVEWPNTCSNASMFCEEMVKELETYGFSLLWKKRKDELSSDVGCDYLYVLPIGKLSLCCSNPRLPLGSYIWDFGTDKRSACSYQILDAREVWIVRNPNMPSGSSDPQIVAWVQKLQAMDMCQELPLDYSLLCELPKKLPSQVKVPEELLGGSSLVSDDKRSRRRALEVFAWEKTFYGYGLGLDGPNERQTSQQFVAQLTDLLEQHSIAFVWKLYKQFGTLSEIFLLDPFETSFVQSPTGQDVYHVRTTKSDGSVGKDWEYVQIAANQVDVIRLPDALRATAKV